MRKIATDFGRPEKAKNYLCFASALGGWPSLQILASPISKSTDASCAMQTLAMQFGDRMYMGIFLSLGNLRFTNHLKIMHSQMRQRL